MDVAAQDKQVRSMKTIYSTNPNTSTKSGSVFMERLELTGKKSAGYTNPDYSNTTAWYKTLEKLRQDFRKT